MRTGALILALAALCVQAGCAGEASPSAGAGSSGAGSSVVGSTVVAPPGGTTTRRFVSDGRRNRASAPRTSPSGLPVSRASAYVVQRQLAPGTCRARGRGAYVLPDRRCTPGAVNPAVTQATIDRTICVSGWTKTVRPPERVTEIEKRQSMAAYGDTRPAHAYEYDHLVSLELGGAVNDARNLWPEPGGSPNPKDIVEDTLHRMVCDGQMRLARAQHIVATDWVTWARQHGGAQSWFVAHGGSASNDVGGA